MLKNQILIFYDNLINNDIVGSVKQTKFHTF